MYITGKNFSYPVSSDYSFKSSKLKDEPQGNFSELEQDTVQIGGVEKTSSPDDTKCRGVNFDVLDKDKTYVGMQYGRRNRLAKQIVRFTKKYCPDADVPAHVFALSYKDGEWWVHESHIITKKEIGLENKGTRKVRAKDWNELGKNAIAETDIYEADFDVDVLDKNANEPYGTGDMVKQLVASIFNFNGKQSDSKGLLCSEYLALGLKDICDFYNLPAWAITPAHFKDYMVKTGAQQVNE